MQRMQRMRHPSRGTVMKEANDESLRAIRCEVLDEVQIIYELGDLTDCHKPARGSGRCTVRAGL
jgi:hypothetical protein